MPTVGVFHTNYWATSVDLPPPVLSKGGYPPWQAAVTASGVVFGPPLDILRPYWQRLRWIVRLVRRLWAYHDPAYQQRIQTWLDRLAALDQEQIDVLEVVSETVQHPQWQAARGLVRECATTLGFNDPHAWVPYSRAVKRDPGQAQNIFRHVKVVHGLKDHAHAEGETLTNPTAHLLAELAYVGFAKRGR